MAAGLAHHWCAPAARAPAALGRFWAERGYGAFHSRNDALVSFMMHAELLVCAEGGCVTSARAASAVPARASAPRVSGGARRRARLKQGQRLGIPSTGGMRKEFYNKIPSHDTGHGTGAHWH